MSIDISGLYGHVLVPVSTYHDLRHLLIDFDAEAERAAIVTNFLGLQGSIFF